MLFSNKACSLFEYEQIVNPTKSLQMIFQVNWKEDIDGLSSIIVQKPIVKQHQRRSPSLVVVYVCKLNYTIIQLHRKGLDLVQEVVHYIIDQGILCKRFDRINHPLIRYLMGWIFILTYKFHHEQISNVRRNGPNIPVQPVCLIIIQSHSSRLRVIVLALTLIKISLFDLPLENQICYLLMYLSNSH